MFIPHTFSKTIFVLEVPDIVVHIDRLAYHKMWEYVKQAPEEISWMGFCTRNEYDFYVHDVILFEQDCNPAHTEAVDFGLADVAEALLKIAGGKDKLKQMRLWGHSHVNMEPDPSGQDIKQTNMFKAGGCDWAIRLICNKKGKLSVSVLLYEENLEIRDVEWQLVYDEFPELAENIKLEIEEKVSFSKDRKTTSGFGSTVKSWHYDNDGALILEIEDGKTKKIPRSFGSKGPTTRMLKEHTFSELELAYNEFNELEQIETGQLIDKKSKTIVYGNWDWGQYSHDVKDFEKEFKLNIPKHDLETK